MRHSNVAHAPDLRRFDHFRLKMCFAPQRCALFQHLNFQNWSEPAVFFCIFMIFMCFSHFDFQTRFAPQLRTLFPFEHEVFLTFWLSNLLRATTACNFWFFISPDGSAPATLASLLFDHPEPLKIRKATCFAANYSTFSRACIFLLLILSLLWYFFFFLFLLWLFPPLLFYLSTLSEIWF